jgi:hypothetical protein
MKLWQIGPYLVPLILLIQRIWLRFDVPDAECWVWSTHWQRHNVVFIVYYNWSQSPLLWRGGGKGGGVSSFVILSRSKQIDPFWKDDIVRSFFIIYPSFMVSLFVVLIRRQVRLRRKLERSPLRFLNSGWLINHKTPPQSIDCWMSSYLLIYNFLPIEMTTIMMKIYVISLFNSAAKVTLATACLFLTAHDIALPLIHPFLFFSTLNY